MRLSMKFLLVLMAAVLPSVEATACSIEETPPFSQSVKQASNIFVFRLMSTTLIHDQHGTAFIEWVEGEIQPVMKIKGADTSYKKIKFTTRMCGGLNMNAGHYFLIATDQSSDTIALGPDDNSIMDITGNYSEHMPEANKNSMLLNAVTSAAFGNSTSNEVDLDRYRDRNLISFTPYFPPPVSERNK